MRFFKASLSLKPPLLSTSEKYAASSKGRRPRHHIWAKGVSSPYHCCREGRIFLVARSPVAPKIKRIAPHDSLLLMCIMVRRFFLKTTVLALSALVNPTVAIVIHGCNIIKAITNGEQVYGQRKVRKVEPIQLKWCFHLVIDPGMGERRRFGLMPMPGVCCSLSGSGKGGQSACPCSICLQKGM